MGCSHQRASLICSHQRTSNERLPRVRHEIRCTIARCALVRTPGSFPWCGHQEYVLYYIHIYLYIYINIIHIIYICIYMNIIIYIYIHIYVIYNVTYILIYLFSARIRGAAHTRNMDLVPLCRIELNRRTLSNCIELN